MLHAPGTDVSLPDDESLFVAVIDDSTTVDGERRYGWTEQTFDPTTGAYSDADPARQGTTTLNYATEVNNRVVAVGELVWMRLKGSVDQALVYECLARSRNALISNGTVSGTINGVNDTFTLDDAPDDGSSIVLIRNGLTQTMGVDYTIVGDTIVYLSGAIPAAGDTHFAIYVSTGAGGGSSVTIVYSGGSSITYSGTTTVVYATGTSLTFQSGSTVVWAGATVNLTLDQTWTITGGKTWTITGGSLSIGSSLTISGSLTIASTAISWSQNTTVTIAASKTVTISGSSSSLWHFGAPLKICDWYFTCYYIDSTWSGGTYTKPASTTDAHRKQLYVLTGAGDCDMTDMDFAGDGQVVGIFNASAGVVSLDGGGFLLPGGVKHELQPSSGAVVVNTSEGALVLASSTLTLREEGDLLSHDGVMQTRIEAHTETGEVRYLAQTEGAISEVPYWSTIDLSATVGGLSGVLGVTYGGTGLNSCTKGDTLYASAANTWAKLAANGTGTKKFLSQTSDSAPAWDQPAFSNITGTATASQVATALLRWTKISLNYANFTAAATSESQVIMAGVAKRFIHQIVMKTQTAWDGPGITNATCSVGTITPTVFNNLVASHTLNPVTPGDTMFSSTGGGMMCPNTGGTNSFAATDIYIKVTSNINMDTMTAGALDIWILESILP